MNLPVVPGTGTLPSPELSTFSGHYHNKCSGHLVRMAPHSDNDDDDIDSQKAYKADRATTRGKRTVDPDHRTSRGRRSIEVDAEPSRSKSQHRRPRSKSRHERKIRVDPSTEEDLKKSKTRKSATENRRTSTEHEKSSRKESIGHDSRRRDNGTERNQKGSADHEKSRDYPSEKELAKVSRRSKPEIDSDKEKRRKSDKERDSEQRDRGTVKERDTEQRDRGGIKEKDAEQRDRGNGKESDKARERKRDKDREWKKDVNQDRWEKDLKYDVGKTKKQSKDDSHDGDKPQARGDGQEDSPVNSGYDGDEIVASDYRTEKSRESSTSRSKYESSKSKLPKSPYKKSPSRSRRVKRFSGAPGLGSYLLDTHVENKEDVEARSAFTSATKALKAKKDLPKTREEWIEHLQMAASTGLMSTPPPPIKSPSTSARQRSRKKMEAAIPEEEEATIELAESEHSRRGERVGRDAKRHTDAGADLSPGTLRTFASEPLPHKKMSSSSRRHSSEAANASIERSMRKERTSATEKIKRNPSPRTEEIAPSRRHRERRESRSSSNEETYQDESLGYDDEYKRETSKSPRKKAASAASGSSRKGSSTDRYYSSSERVESSSSRRIKSSDRHSPRKDKYGVVEARRGHSDTPDLKTRSDAKRTPPSTKERRRAFKKRGSLSSVSSWRPPSMRKSDTTRLSDHQANINARSTSKLRPSRRASEHSQEEKRSLKDEPPVVYDEVDIFTYYSWSTARQSFNKTQKERLILRNSIRDNSLFRFNEEMIPTAE